MIQQSFSSEKKVFLTIKLVIRDGKKVMVVVRFEFSNLIQQFFLKITI